MPGIDAKSDAIYELVEEGSGVEQLATGFTFTEGPIWHPEEQVLYFSDMPADIRRKVTLDGTVTEVRNPSFKCNGMTLDADLNLLVCEHVTSSLVRERPDGVRETLAFHWQGKYLNSPNDVMRPLRRDDLLLRSLVRALPRLRDRARAGARLAGRLPDPAGRRPGRARARGRRGRVRDAERALLLARRVAAVHQRHPPRATSRSSTSTPTAPSRTAGCSSRASARA